MNQGVLKYLGEQNELKYLLHSSVNILNHQWEKQSRLTQVP